jgi:hypothetical protein
MAERSFNKMFRFSDPAVHLACMTPALLIHGTITTAVTIVNHNHLQHQHQH